MALTRRQELRRDEANFIRGLGDESRSAAAQRLEAVVARHPDVRNRTDLPRTAYRRYRQEVLAALKAVRF
jgi:hypothetical protein